MLTMQPAVSGRYGFHPCDYDTFRELKAFHGLLLRAYRQFRAYRRWAAKKGTNRYRQERAPRYLGGHPVGERTQIPRPAYPECVTGTEKGYMLGWADADAETPTWIREYPAFREHGRRNLYHHVLHAYRLARKPMATEADVVPLDLPDDWRETLAALRAYYGQ